MSVWEGDASLVSSIPIKSYNMSAISAKYAESWWQGFDRDIPLKIDYPNVFLPLNIV